MQSRLIKTITNLILLYVLVISRSYTVESYDWFNDDSLMNLITNHYQNPSNICSANLHATRRGGLHRSRRHRHRLGTVEVRWWSTSSITGSSGTYKCDKTRSLSIQELEASTNFNNFI